MLRAVLDNHLPREWQDASYSNRTYQLFSVPTGSNEFAQVTTPFAESQPALTIKSLQRVQNPYQLGRLIVRKEQQQFRSQHLTALTYYHPLEATDLNTALEFNMDVRRYKSLCDRHHSNYKNPVFFSLPGEALSVLSNRSNKVIFVCLVLEPNGQPRTTYKNFDTEYMPTYVAMVES